MTDPFTHDAGPYVLGALAPADRRGFEQHLTDCPRCRAEVHEFAGLPGLLSRLPAAEALADPPDPVTLFPAMVREAGVRRRSRRRRAVLAGVAAAVAVAAGSAALTEVLDRPPPAAAAVAFSRAEPDIPASAEATLTEVRDGTRIDMTCRYEGSLDREGEYVLVVVPKEGRPQRLSSWPVLSRADYRLAVVAPLPRDRISLFEVTTASGKSLLTLRP